jgi:AGCS family alanine or glycine:cation symporter
MTADEILLKVADIGNSVFFFNVLSFSNQYKIPFLIFWLISASVFFTVILKFINFLQLPKMIYRFSKEKNHNSRNENLASTKSISLSAIGGAVDLGTIFAIATIVSIGGPGTIFWLIIGGIISTSIRFFEVFCGHYFRKKVFSNGEFVGYTGGPYIYIQKAFSFYKIPKIGKIFVKIYSLNIIMSTFFSLQINQTIHVLTHAFPAAREYDWIFSVLFAIIIVSIAIKGISSVARFSTKVVPIMIYIYIACTIYILIWNIEKILPSISLIFKDAMSFNKINGNHFGCMILGMQRAFFCNEAGTGSSAIIHANSNNKDSYKEAFLSMIEPIVSVLIVCLCSGMIVITTGVYNFADQLSGVELIMKSFGSIHKDFSYITLIVVPLFGLTTAISWAFYGSKSWIHLFGKKTVNIYYTLLFVGYFISGTTKNFSIILNVADIFGLSSTLTNIIALFMLSGFVFKKIRKIKK